MLKLVLPKGSLEKATFDLFEAADLSVGRNSSVDYRASIADPRVDGRASAPTRSAASRPAAPCTSWARS